MGKRQVLIITGASGGIGSAVARLVSEQGTILFLQGHCHTDYLSQELKETLHSSVNTLIYQADLSIIEEQDRFITAVLQQIERLSLENISDLALINAAGIDLMSQESKTLTFDQKLNKIIQIDLMASVRLSRTFGQKIIEWIKEKEISPSLLNCAILFLGWDGVARGMEGDTAQLYAAAKGGIVSYARSLAQTFAPYIRVLSLSPGWISTTWGSQASETSQKRGRKESLLERWGTAQEVAQLIHFLISKNASYINAQNIEINGGFNYKLR